MKNATTYCSYCVHPVAIDAKSGRGGVAWCPNCRRVFPIPFFKIPGWIAGVMLIMLQDLFL